MVFNVEIRIKSTFRITGNLKINCAYTKTHFVLERHISTLINRAALTEFRKVGVPLTDALGLKCKLVRQS